MKKLKNINEVKEGDILKIVGKCEKDNYESVSIKRIIHLKNKLREWDEIILCKKNNNFFNFDMYLKGASWVEQAYIIEKRTNGGE